MTHRPPKPRGPPFVKLANGPSTYGLSEDAFRPLLKHELMKGGVQGWEKMPDMTDSDPISFQFKGIKSDNDDYDLLGYVKAETLREALELARPMFAEFRQKCQRINVEFTVR